MGQKINKQYVDSYAMKMLLAVKDVTHALRALRSKQFTLLSKGKRDTQEGGHLRTSLLRMKGKKVLGRGWKEHILAVCNARYLETFA